ncbi:hypothetical protein MVI27_08965 [Chryseobacterium salipaludis]|uniref:DUF2683 family protein n=1 Tax=Chryseobacterium TaxID=59732 RepID=UPI001FF237BC|nr:MULTISPECIES: DUF2683 family protein [Chryseobacterium]MCJ8498390.1 hypothetical protein [Chryseobacterium salipaludis]MCX3297285.1 hypothetical protein [Planobacterium sp. JC490]
MENIIIIPESKKQSAVIKAFLKEIKIRFEVEKDDTEMTKEEFFAKIDRAKQEVKEGKVTRINTT